MTPRQWGLTALLVVIPAGLLVATLWRDRDLERWRARAQAAERHVREWVQQADQARREAVAWRAQADSLRAHRDTLILTRWRTITDTAWLGADTTLAGCREALTGLRSLCRQALDSVGAELAQRTHEADAYRTTADSLAVSDSLRGLAVDSLRALVRAVPRPAPWYRPRFVVGVGCAGGSGVGCGLMAGVGFTFGGGR